MNFAITKLAKSFSSLQVLDDITFSFSESSIIAILGPSGCGKTTILNIISGILSQDSGVLEGFEDKHYSYCFQEPRLLPWLDAESNIKFALSSYLERGTDPSRINKRINRFLFESGLSEFKNFMPDQLSGGMQKRLALARAFSFPSDFLLLDEAFSAVDLKQKLELMSAFFRLWSDERPTTIVVTHDLHDALYLADDVIVLSQRPSRVIGQLHIDIPHPERTFASEAISHYERELYRLLGFDDYERNHGFE